jgi:SRSO17 transposase
MKEVNHWIEKGFKYYGDMVVSDRLEQGVDVELFSAEFDKELRKRSRAGVYIIVEKTTGRVLKFGQSANIRHRIYTQYKTITNSTNTFIRENIKERYKRVSFFVYLIPNTEVELIGYKFKTNLQKGLEEAILKEYSEEYQTIPELNRQRN